MTRHKVHFFKIDTRERDIASTPGIFEKICKEVVDLPVAQKSLKLSADMSYRLNYFERNGDHYTGKIVKYRSDSMITGSANDDELTDFTLEDGKKFTEVSHFMFSPETGVLTMEYNHNGVRHAMFMRYLNAVQATYSSDVSFFIAELLMHPDVIQEVQNANKIKSITVGMPVAKLPTHGERNNLLDGLAAGAMFGNPGQVALTISGAKSKGDRSPLISVEGLMTAINSNEIDLDIFGKVSVEIATDFGSEIVNLLENKLEAAKEWNVAITNDNANRWFDDIRQMYINNKPIIERAISDYDSLN